MVDGRTGCVEVLVTCLVGDSQLAALAIHGNFAAFEAISVHNAKTSG
jgi:hypothetical protein